MGWSPGIQGDNLGVELSGEILGLFVAENTESGGNDGRKGLYAGGWEGSSEHKEFNMVPVEYVERERRVRRKGRSGGECQGLR